MLKTNENLLAVILLLALTGCGGGSSGGGTTNNDGDAHSPDEVVDPEDPLTDDKKEGEFCLAVSPQDLNKLTGGITGTLCGSHDNSFKVINPLNISFNPSGIDTSTIEGIRTCFEQTDFNTVYEDISSNGLLDHNIFDLSCGLLPKGEIELYAPVEHGGLGRFVTASYDEDGFYHGLFQAYYLKSQDLVVSKVNFSHGSRNGVHYKHKVQICDLNESPEFCNDDSINFYVPESEVEYAPDYQTINYFNSIYYEYYKHSQPMMPDLKDGKFTKYFIHTPNEIWFEGTYKDDEKIGGFNYFIGECQGRMTEPDQSIVGDGLPTKGFFNYITETYPDDGSRPVTSWPTNPYIQGNEYIQTYLLSSISELYSGENDTSDPKCYLIF